MPRSVLVTYDKWNTTTADGVQLRGDGGCFIVEVDDANKPEFFIDCTAAKVANAINEAISNERQDVIGNFRTTIFEV